jgi:hypothetical protein
MPFTQLFGYLKKQIQGNCLVNRKEFDNFVFCWCSTQVRQGENYFGYLIEELSLYRCDRRVLLIAIVVIYVFYG